jgi:uncharacterized protein DUF4159
MLKRRGWILLLPFTLVPAAVLWGFQMRYNQRYEFEMQDPVEDPPDALVKAEFSFARLRYRSFRFGRGYWGRGSWGIDANRADRLFAEALRRLSRVNTRSVEEIIDVDDGPMFDYPWLYAVEVGHWELSDAQAKKLREFLDRGGFLMVDDFHGTQEWAVFMASLRRVFPDKQVEEIPNDHSIFHMLSDLSDRVQVPGRQYLRSGRTWEDDGYNARWLGIFDDKGRIQVAICHNMDLGDALQYADDPYYPEKFASLALRIAVNYVTYEMTH